VCTYFWCGAGFDILKSDFLEKNSEKQKQTTKDFRKTTKS